MYSTPPLCQCCCSLLLVIKYFLFPVIRQLGEIWTKLKIELPCLNSVCLNLCVRCELCPTSGSAPCVRHGEQECSHDDCAHYLDLNRQPLVCKKKRCQLPKDLKQKCRPWIGVSQVSYFNIQFAYSHPHRSQFYFTPSQRYQNSYILHPYNMNKSMIWTWLQPFGACL